MGRVKSIRFGRSEADQAAAGRLMEALRDNITGGQQEALAAFGQDRDPRTAQAGPAATPPPDLDRYPTIDLSALPPAARPAMAAALRAAVGRLAAGELLLGDETRGVEDALLAELMKSQMRSILAGAEKAEANPAADVCRHGTPFRYACEACGDGPGGYDSDDLPARGEEEK